LVDITITKSERLGSEVDAPPSKAYTHRALIASLLSNGTSKISNPLDCDDTQATLAAIKALGARLDHEKNQWVLKGLEEIETPKTPVNCHESGATMRFMIPVAALAPRDSTFEIGPSLGRRPLAPLLQSLEQLGVKCNFQQNKETSLVRIHGGGIKGGKASIRGDISSQFISGLLFACPKAKENVEINVTTPLESKSYVEMTMEVLMKHGIKVHATDDLTRFRIPPNQKYQTYNHEVPGDFSSAAFLLAAAAITSSRVKVKNLDSHTVQGDKAILNILNQMGLNLVISDDHVEVRGGQLRAIDVDARDIPDLVPVCSALACYSNGTFGIHNAKRLKYKESDRLSSLEVELKKMGARIRIDGESVVVEGPCSIHGAVVDPHNDHRIAMACAVTALGADDETTIQNSECVKKSYPKFFEDLHSLGANVVGWQLHR